MRRARGFTVAELLAVLAMASLLIVLSTPRFLRTVAMNETAEAVNTLVGEVTRVRGLVKRQGAPITLTVTNNGAAVISDQTRSLKLVKATGTLNLTFLPPYGTLAPGSALPQSVTLSSTRDAGVSRQVSVVSTFGKVGVR